MTLVMAGRGTGKQKIRNRIFGAKIKAIDIKFIMPFIFKHFI